MNDSSLFIRLFSAIFLGALIVKVHSSKMQLLVVYQDATDADNLMQIKNLVLQHGVINSCLAKSLKNRTDKITDEQRLHLVLTGRPGLFGIPSHTRELLEGVRWLKDNGIYYAPEPVLMPNGEWVKSNYFGYFLDHMVGSRGNCWENPGLPITEQVPVKKNEKKKFIVMEKKYGADGKVTYDKVEKEFELVEQETRDKDGSDVEFIKYVTKTRDCEDWKLKGKTPISYVQAVKEDSKLLSESNALKFMLLILEAKYGKNPTAQQSKAVMDCVNIYDGGIPTYASPKSKTIAEAEAEPLDGRVLITPLSHQVHVYDIFQYTAQGLLSSIEEYKAEYLEWMNDEGHKPTGVFWAEEEVVIDQYEFDNAGKPIGKPTKAIMKKRMYSAPNDDKLADRRVFFGNKLREKNSKIMQLKHLNGLKMLDISKLQDILRNKDVEYFDAMVLSPIIGLARTLENVSGKIAVPNGLIKKLRYFITVAFTKEASNLFYDNFNTMGDMLASIKVYTAMSKEMDSRLSDRKNARAHHRPPQNPLDIAMLVIPSQLGKVHDADKLFIQNYITASNRSWLESVDATTNVVKERDIKVDIDARSYGTWNLAKGIEMYVMDPRTPGQFIKEANGEYKITYDLNGVFDTPANDFLYLIRNNVKFDEFTTTHTKVNTLKDDDEAKKAWEHRILTKMTVTIPPLDLQLKREKTETIKGKDGKITKNMKSTYFVEDEFIPSEKGSLVIHAYFMDWHAKAIKDIENKCIQDKKNRCVIAPFIKAHEMVEDPIKKVERETEQKENLVKCFLKLICTKKTELETAGVKRCSIM